ncbi:hypothetical protein BLOT_000117 [Blomia tropicalis]|nr:hypothetical protein BLOT_000117 [Blomia tropicalis]
MNGRGMHNRITNITTTTTRNRITTQRLNEKCRNKAIDMFFGVDIGEVSEKINWYSREKM